MDSSPLTLKWQVRSIYPQLAEMPGGWTPFCGCIWGVRCSSKRKLPTVVAKRYHGLPAAYREVTAWPQSLLICGLHPCLMGSLIKRNRTQNACSRSTASKAILDLDKKNPTTKNPNPNRMRKVKFRKQLTTVAW